MSNHLKAKDQILSKYAQSKNKWSTIFSITHSSTTHKVKSVCKISRQRNLWIFFFFFLQIMSKRVEATSTLHLSRQLINSSNNVHFTRVKFLVLVMGLVYNVKKCRATNFNTPPLTLPPKHEVYYTTFLHLRQHSIIIHMYV